MRLLVTRPEDDGKALETRLVAEGHRVTLEPLTRIELCRGDISLDGVQALVATSRNGLRALEASPALSRARRLPVFTVGPATAAFAEALGFGRIVRGPGRARDLVGVIAAAIRPKDGGVLHLSGDHLAFDIVGELGTLGFAARRLIIYTSVAVETLTPGTRARLAAGEIDGVILMSPRASKIYAGLVENAHLAVAVRNLLHLCLSEEVARPLVVLRPSRVEVARSPNSEDMIELVNQAAKQSI